MTIAELNRYIQSYQRREKQKAQERAAFDYIQATFTAKCIGCLFSDNGTIPTLEEVYSVLFEEKAQETVEEKRKLKNELSALRFKEFANYHNKRIKNVGGGNLNNE